MIEGTKIIFFDCGNTLWDDSLAKKRMVDRILKYLKISSYNEFELFIENNEVSSGYSPFYDAINKLKQEGVSISDIRNEIDKLFNEMSFEEYAALHPINKQVKSLLDFLFRKVKLGIIANQHNIAKRLLKHYGIYDYFETVVLGCDCKIKKPDEEIFRVACQKSGVLPCEAIMVGDSYYNDMIPANKVGMRTVMVSKPRLRKKEINYWFGNIAEFYKGLKDGEI